MIIYISEKFRAARYKGEFLNFLIKTKFNQTDIANKVSGGGGGGPAPAGGGGGGLKIKN